MDAKTKALIRDVAQQTATETVEKTLISLGIDHDRPIEVQRDMAALREVRDLIDDPEFQKDMLHIRKWRRAMDGVTSKGLLTISGMIMAGIVAAIWMGVKQYVGRP